MYSGLYTETLLLLRDCFHLLGDCMVAEGRLGHWEDIFYLYLSEVQVWALGEGECLDLAALAAARQEEMRCSRDATVPEVIYGEMAPPLVSGDAAQLRGIPTSRGYYAGPARVVRGLADFAKVAAGDVLVIPYSDVGWTPLFARAGAVIAESGGILSHSSIVAREYNLPAVVSVAGAMGLTDGVLVEVDGFSGQIYVRDGVAMGVGGADAGAASE
jgi:pyruvate,water dikinase